MKKLLGFGFFGSLGMTIWMLVIVAVIVAGGFALWAAFYPLQLRVERLSVEQSKSYNDSRNTALMNYKVQYENLAVKLAEDNGANPTADAEYTAQEKSILDSMCQMISTMTPDAVNPLATSFLSQHGGCR